MLANAHVLGSSSAIIMLNRNKSKLATAATVVYTLRSSRTIIIKEGNRNPKFS